MTAILTVLDPKGLRVQVEAGRYYHPTRVARAGTPVCFRFRIF